MSLDNMKKHMETLGDRGVKINDNGVIEITLTIEIEPKDIMEKCGINEKQLKILVENYIDDPLYDMIDYDYVLDFIKDGYFHNMEYDKDEEVNEVLEKYGWDGYNYGG
jgi:hypothetical protein